MLVNNIFKIYQAHIKVLEYNQPRMLFAPVCRIHANMNCQLCHPRHVCPKALVEAGFDCLRCKTVEQASESLARSKTAITDYVLSNEFDLFCTFTFDPKKVDSMDIKLAKQKMSKWLNNQRRISPDLMYLIVAERHKSGRLHFHALFKNYQAPLVFAHRKHKGREVWNIQKWDWGFSTAIKIDNVGAVGLYMQKYITKDMIKMSNKKRYWVSRNLQKPQKLYNIQVTESLKHLLDLNVAYVKENEFTIYKTRDIIK